MNAPTLRPAVFLDRDGTVIEEVGYLSRPEQFRLLPGAAAAIRQLNERDIPVVLVTNQSGVARGKFSENDLAEIHRHLRELLATEDARLDAIYYCPHHPREGQAPYRRDCVCRKPAPGMLQQAAREHGLDLAASVMIGDSLRDLEAGAAAGCKTRILVMTGHGNADKARLPCLEFSAQACDDLAAAIASVIPA